MGIREAAASRTDSYPFDPENLVIVGYDTEERDQLVLFDSESRRDVEISPEMVESVMESGVIQPIVVAWRNKRVEVVDGRRRVRALRLGNKKLVKGGHAAKTVLATVRGGSDVELIEAMMIANEHRLADPPSVRSENIVRYMDVTGKKEKATAAAFGCTRQSINNYCRISKCCPEVKQALDDKQVRMADVLTLHKLDVEGQLRELQKAIRKKKEDCDPPGGEGEGGGDSGGDGDGDGGDGGDWNDDGNVPLRAPRKNVIQKVVELVTEKDEFDGTIAADVISALQWVLGKGEAEKVPGLTDVLSQIDT